MSDEQPVWLTTREAAARIGLKSRGGMRKYLKRHPEIRQVRRERTILVRRDDLDRSLLPLTNQRR